MYVRVIINYYSTTHIHMHNDKQKMSNGNISGVEEINIINMKKKDEKEKKKKESVN